MRLPSRTTGPQRTPLGFPAFSSGMRNRRNFWKSVPSTRLHRVCVPGRGDAIWEARSVVGPISNRNSSERTPLVLLRPIGSRLMRFGQKRRRSSAGSHSRVGSCASTSMRAPLLSAPRRSSSAMLFRFGKTRAAIPDDPKSRLDLGGAPHCGG